MSKKDPAEKVVRDIRRKTRRRHSTEEKIRIVLEGLRGEESIAVLCRREGIAESLYYSWSKEFLEAGKKRLAGDTARQATSNEVKAVPPIYSIYGRNLGILHHHRIPFLACIRSSKSSRTARRSTQKSLPCDSR